MISHSLLGGEVPDAFLESIKQAGPLTHVDKKVLQRTRDPPIVLQPDDKKVEEIINLPENSCLTSQQRLAVISAITNRLTLIQGEPFLVHECALPWMSLFGFRVYLFKDSFTRRLFGCTVDFPTKPVVFLTRISRH